MFLQIKFESVLSSHLAKFGGAGKEGGRGNGNSMSVMHRSHWQFAEGGTAGEGLPQAVLMGA